MTTMLGVALTAFAALPSYGQALAGPVLSFDLRNAPIEDVLGAFQGLMPGFRFVKKPEVKGKVTALMENADLRTALRKVCEDVNATYKVDQGTYIIEAKTTTGPRARPRGPTGGVPIPGRTPGRTGVSPRTGPRVPTRPLPGR
ncbi:MAG: hypothetical protein ACE5R4_07470 [Armatimonadota bacterium]